LKKRSAFVAWTALVAAIALALGACAHRPPVVPVAPPRPARDTLRVRLEGRVEVVPLEEYVAGCVVAELGSINAPPPAAAAVRDVQAILCRSFAIASPPRHAAEGIDLCATTHCQMFRPVPPTVIGRLSREAAARTAGLVLRAGGRPVAPVYFADCGGRTSAADEVWGGPAVAYLQSVADDTCARRPPWRFEVTVDQLADALRSAQVEVPQAFREVTVARADSAGRASLVRLVGQRTVSMRGDAFRHLVIAAFGPASLKSTLFAIERDGPRLVFVGRGNGHGVGLCQAGLVARASRGDAPGRILADYFPGTTVEPR
jgi:stage II sporulation protein D